MGRKRLIGPTRRLLVIGTLSLGALPSVELVVEDTSTGELLGEAYATVTPIKVGEDRVVFAGPRESPEHHVMVLIVPGEHGGTTPYPIRGEGWMSQPVPYTPGMVITAIGQNGNGRELFRLDGPPIRPNADGVLRPMLGPSWVQYGPDV